MTPLTPVLSRYWDDPQSWTLDTYLRHDGYQALDTALGMDPDDGDRAWSRSPGLRGRGGAGFPTGQKWSFINQARTPNRTIWWSTPTSPNPVRARTFR